MYITITHKQILVSRTHIDSSLIRRNTKQVHVVKSTYVFKKEKQ